MPDDDADHRLYKLAANLQVNGSVKRTLNAVLILWAGRAARPPPEERPRKRWVLVVPSLFVGGAGFLAANPEALGQLLGN